MQRLSAHPRTAALIAAMAAAAAALAVLALHPALGSQAAALLERHARQFLANERRNLLSVQSCAGLLAIAVVLLIEVVFQGYRGSALSRLLRPTRSTVQDIFCFLVGALGLSGLFVTIFSLNLPGFAADALGRITPHGVMGFSNPILQFLWLTLVVDFAKYWMHRFQHSVPFWWEAHKFHHAAAEMNVITTSRGHPLDSGFRLVFLAVPLALVGSSVAEAFIIALVFEIHAGLTHSMLNWRWGWIGRWVLVSPIVHRIHHSEMEEHFDQNFAAIFVIWDRIFGTYYQGRTVNETIGVTENPYNKSSFVTDQLLCAAKVLKAGGNSLRLPRIGAARQQPGAAVRAAAP